MKYLLARSLDTSASLTALMIVFITASSLSSTSTIAVRRSPFSLGGVGLPVVVVFTMVSPQALAAFSGVFVFWPFFLEFAIVIMIITVLR